MKYIKKFKRKPKYWIVPTDDRLESSLRKIGAPDKFIKNKITHESARKKYKYIFIGFDGRVEEDFYCWGWNPFEDSFIDNYYNDGGYSFEGGVNFTQEENLQLEVDLMANKYNL